MFNKLKELKAMQAKAEEIKKRLDTVTVKGCCDNEKVQVICTGNKKVEQVLISEELLNIDHKVELQNSVTEAVNNAFKQAENVMETEMKTVAGGLLGGI